MHCLAIPAAFFTAAAGAGGAVANIGTPASRGTAVATTSAVTALFTPAANAVLIAWVGAQHATALPANPTCSGGGLTWTLIVQKDYEPVGAQPKQKMSCFRAQAPAFPSAFAVTGGSTTAELVSVQVTEITNADPTPTNFATCEDPIGDPNITLGLAPASTSVVLSGVIFGALLSNIVDATAPSGFNTISQFNNGTLHRMEIAYDATPGTGAAWTSDNTSAIGISVEIKAAAQKPPPNAYPNGYVYRRRIIVPPAAIDATLTNFVAGVAATNASFASVANGGHVENTSGWDIRFETAAGVKLAHELEKYDPVTGTIVAWVKVTTVSDVNNTIFFLYYGKEGMTGSEENVASVWADYLAVWHLGTSLTDRTSNARVLTSIGTVPTGTTDMMGNSIDLAGAGHLKITNANWLNGLGTFTAQQLVRPE